MQPENDPTDPDPAVSLPPLPRALPCALVWLDAEGAVAGWTSTAEAWFGLGDGHLGCDVEAVGLPGTERWAPLARAALERGEAGRTGPLRTPGRGGAPRWVELAVAPREDGGGAVLAATDVTGPAEAARAAEMRAVGLERRAAELEALREIAVAASSSLVPDEVFGTICARTRTLLRATFALVDLPLMDGRPQWCGAESVPDAFRVQLPSLLRRVRETGETWLAGTCRGEHGVPPERTVPGPGCALLLPLRPEGEIPGVLVVGWSGPADLDAATVGLAETLAAQAAAAFRNASLYAELQEAAGKRDRFFSAMSHDLRTPITAIVGYSELLQDGIVGELDERQQEMVERISQVASQLSGLVNDILDLAKLDAGRMEFHREEVRLGDLVDEAVIAVEPQAQSKSLVLRLDVEEHRGTLVTVDRPRVRQILVNLLSNSVKFTERGEVRVTAGAGPEGSWIEVRDTGPGIPAGSEEAVFEEFLQIAAGNKSKREPGSGLGLAISRRLARAMGGDLAARSEPGSGAAFVLHLPTFTSGS